MSATTAANPRRSVATGKEWGEARAEGARKALPTTTAATAGQ